MNNTGPRTTSLGGGPILSFKTVKISTGRNVQNSSKEIWQRQQRLQLFLGIISLALTENRVKIRITSFQIFLQKKIIQTNLSEVEETK